MKTERIPSNKHYELVTPEQIKKVVAEILHLPEDQHEQSGMLHEKIRQKIDQLRHLFGKTLELSPFYYALIGSSEKEANQVPGSEKALIEIQDAIIAFVNNDILPELDEVVRMPQSEYVQMIKNQMSALPNNKVGLLVSEMQNFIRVLQKQNPQINLNHIAETSYFIGGGDTYAGHVDPALAKEIGDKTFDKFLQVLNQVNYSGTNSPSAPIT